MKRRPRQPRPIRDPIAVAIGGATRFTAQERATFIALPQRALEQLAAGRGSAQAWQDLADALNLSEALAELRIAGNLGETLHAAQAALAAQMHRVHAGRGWTLYGPEIIALREGLWLYGVQLEHCSASEYRRAVAIVRNRVAAALAGNAGRRTVVHAPLPPAAP